VSKGVYTLHFKRIAGQTTGKRARGEVSNEWVVGDLAVCGGLDSAVSAVRLSKVQSLTDFQNSDQHVK